MARRFKFRISRMIPSFQSCRSKDPKTLPSNPVPSSSLFHLPSSSHNHRPHNHPSEHHRSSIKRQLSTALGCGFRISRPPPSSPTTIRHSLSSHPSVPSPAVTPRFIWGKEDEWNVIAKIHDYDVDNNNNDSNATPIRRKIYNTAESAPCSSADTEVIIPPPPLLLPRRSKRRGSRRNKMASCARRQSLHQLAGIVRLSTSSADSGLFFSEEELEKESELETLVCSSRSFSTTTTDSSTEFSPHLETIREGPATTASRRKRRTVKKRLSRRARRSSRVLITAKSKGSADDDGGGNRRVSTSSDDGTTTSSPARLSVFQKMMPCGVIDGKVRESFAVVKKTEDPYSEFKRSMMEMVMEKEMFEESELERLLQCFLSLNSRDHHGAIVQAFAEIWEEMFC